MMRSSSSPAQAHSPGPSDACCWRERARSTSALAAAACPARSQLGQSRSPAPLDEGRVGRTSRLLSSRPPLQLRKSSTAHPAAAPLDLDRRQPRAPFPRRLVAVLRRLLPASSSQAVAPERPPRLPAEEQPAYSSTVFLASPPVQHHGRHAPHPLDRLARLGRRLAASRQDQDAAGQARPPQHDRGRQAQDQARPGGRRRRRDGRHALPRPVVGVGRARRDVPARDGEGAAREDVRRPARAVGRQAGGGRQAEQGRVRRLLEPVRPSVSRSRFRCRPSRC